MTQITQQELIELMRDSAQNAIATTKAEFDIELDGTAASIQLVDDILISWLGRYRDQVLEDKALFTLCNIYGSYVGEVFKALVGGEWISDVTDRGAPFVVLQYTDKTYAFAGICYQRLFKDSQVSVADYFNKAVANSTQ